MAENTNVKQPSELGRATEKNDGFRPVGKTAFGKGRFNKDEYDSKLLDLARVTRVTGGGKRLRFRAVVAAGDRKSKVGIGVGKGRDVSQAIEQATVKAKKNAIGIVISEGTVPHEVRAKYGPSVVLLKPQKVGKGIVAGGVVRTICELAGVKNVSSKILSHSKNKLNNARATMEALKRLKIKTKQ